MQHCSKQANKILKCHVHDCRAERCPRGKVNAYVGFFLPVHTSSVLDCSQAQKPSTTKCVTLGSFHWWFMALWGLVSSDKLQRLPNVYPNLFNFTPCYSLGRLKLLRLCGQSEETGFGSDLCLKLLTRALSSWSESVYIGSTCTTLFYQLYRHKVYLRSWYSVRGLMGGWTQETSLCEL